MFADSQIAVILSPYSKYSPPEVEQVSPGSHVPSGNMTLMLGSPGSFRSISSDGQSDATIIGAVSSSG